MEPVAQAKKTVYISVHNTSGNPDLDMKSALKAAFKDTGYKLVSDPDKAYFILQVNVLHAERMDDASYKKSVSGGFGTGAASDAVASVATHKAATGAIDFLTNTLVHDVYYTIVIDMEIREKIKGAVTVRGKQNSQQKMNDGYDTYRTRIVARANKVNLKESEAMPVVRDRVVQVIMGSFCD